MPLSAGVRLGPYEIVSPLGAGGMGEVYKGRDTRLDRIVAIKVLPAQLASDPQFRERFDREARTISQLDHPHICALHDLGQENGIDFLVLQFLEGETLADRLTKGALPIDQALRLGIEIAGALDKAHRAGIVHRDLKPGNIMLVRRGGPSGPPIAVLLDFGLAKTGVVGAGFLGAPKPPHGEGGSRPGASILPTTPPNLTAQGTILGTFQYMAPEQLEGQEADPRTDIFAFGAVLYEMLTGKKAFEGKSHASLIGSILKDTPPPPSTLQPSAPPFLDHVIQRCLAKDPDERWQNAGDIMRELRWIAQTPAAVTTGGQPRRPWRVVAAIAAAAIVALAVVALTTVWMVRGAPDPAGANEMRLEANTPPTDDPTMIAISPEGQRLAFVARVKGVTQVWVRPLDAVIARALGGTEDAVYPFWSPDGQSIGFFADQKLKRIDVQNGLVQTLAATPVARGGAWNSDGVILVAPNTSGPLYRLPATGGTPMAVTTVTPGQNDRFPQFLPDGRHFMYYRLGTPDESGVYVGELGTTGGRRLTPADTTAVYSPPGFLLFARQATLLAQRFDPATLVLSGQPFTVADSIAINASGAYVAAFSASSTGVLAYRTGAATGQRQLVWVDRTGKRLSTLAGPDASMPQNIELSHDGSRVALDRTVNGNTDIWIIDTVSSIATRFTFLASAETVLLWSPDGRRVIFRSRPAGVFDLYEKGASGSESEKLLLQTTAVKMPLDWSPDGRFVLYYTTDNRTGRDIWALPMDGAQRTPIQVVRTEFEEVHGQFSPDGRWVVYASNQSGRFEIYAQRFPESGGTRQLSTEGGVQPRWRRDGRELFYIAPDGSLMAVPITISPDGQTLTSGAAVGLFDSQIAGGITPAGNKHQYAVAPDGQRFLINQMTDNGMGAPITVAINWAKGR